VNLCQAAGAAAIRARVADATVGTTHVISPMHTASPMGLFQEAKRKADALAHGVFLEPGFGMGYPQDAGLFVDHVERNVRPGDEEAMTVDFDFIGAQYYASMRAIPVPVVGALPLRLPLDKGTDRDQMGHWNNPDGLYDAIAVVNRYDRCPRIVVTENGASFPDVVEGAGDDARVHDLRRIDYLRKHLGAVARAKADGMPVDGYFYWSFMDNFEWALGYRPRFGLVHVDFATKARVVKDSGRWFRAFLAS
jgi:beta-glucosidase